MTESAQGARSNFPSSKPRAPPAINTISSNVVDVRRIASTVAAVEHPAISTRTMRLV